MGETCSFPKCDKDKGGAFVIDTPEGPIQLPLCTEHIAHMVAVISKFASEGKDFLEEIFRDA